jgi:hypothetical protein
MQALLAEKTNLTMCNLYRIRTVTKVEQKKDRYEKHNGLKAKKKN